MFNDIIRKKLEEALGGSAKITIEIDPAQKQKDDEELKKQGLAPSNPKKDEEVKGKKLEVEMEQETPEDDDSELAASMMDEDEMQGLIEMQGKPKTLFGKMKQKMAKGVAKKEISGEA